MFEYPKSIQPLEPYIVLGETGLRVSRLTLGAMSFGNAWAPFMGECDKEEARLIFKQFIKAGGNFIDTAVNYQEGESETWLGEFIKELEEEDELFDRDQLVIATKFTINTQSGVPNAGGNSRKNMYQSLKTSLKRLGTDYVDILYLHVWDYTASAKEMMRGFNDLVSSGMVRYLGISDTPAWKVAQMNTIADHYGWAKFSIYQGKYNFGERVLEYDIRQVCEEFNMGITPWSILGAGKYTGRIQRGTEDNHDGRKISHISDEDYDVIDVLLEVTNELNAAIAEKEGIEGDLDDETKVTPAQVTLAWALNQPSITTLLVGMRKLSQLNDNLRALRIRLNDDQLERLNKVSAPKPWFPFTMTGTDLFGTRVAKRGGRYVPSTYTLTQTLDEFNIL